MQIGIAENHGESAIFDRAAIDQVYDYDLDLKDFHLGSHAIPIVPVLVATCADGGATQVHWADDLVDIRRECEPSPIGVRRRLLLFAVGSPQVNSSEIVNRQPEADE